MTIVTNSIRGSGSLNTDASEMMKEWLRGRLRRALNICQLEDQARELRCELARLREEFVLNPSALGKSYDLIRLGNASFLVPTHDNLYNNFVPADCKGLTIEKHLRLSQEAVLPSLATLRSDVTKLMWLYLDMLFHSGQRVHLIDIGAWVGDVAIRLGVFATLRGGEYSAECIDPSLAGTLIPYNAELNGLAKQITYIPVGISLNGLPQLFSQIPGHSDSSRLSSLQENGWLINTPIFTRTLEQVLLTQQDGRHLIVKVDIEGIDALVLLENRHRLINASLAIEFAPHQAQYADCGAEAFIEALQESHSVFDVCYLPRPTRASIVQCPREFVACAERSPYGYTDILAVPKSLDCHDAIIKVLGKYAALEPSYMLA